MIDLYKPLSLSEPRQLQPFVPAFAISQLTENADPAATYAARVKSRPMLLDNPARKRDASKGKQKEEGRVKRKRPRKLKRKPGKLIGKELRGIKYSHLLPLHHLWLGYMSELLGLAPSPGLDRNASASMNASAMPSSAGMHPKLVKADFHGSIMTVQQSKNPSLVGLAGIVVHETENAFRVVTSKDKVKLLPKQNSVFTFAVPLFSTLPPTATFISQARSLAAPTPTEDTLLPISSAERGHLIDHSSTQQSTEFETVYSLPYIEFTLYGNQFRFRSAERVGRKFKHKETIEL